MFHIIKSTRRSDVNAPYVGPSCREAGVRPGRVYNDRAEAEADAARLTAVNPVGFEVVDAENPEEIADRIAGRYRDARNALDDEFSDTE